MSHRWNEREEQKVIDALEKLQDAQTLVLKAAEDLCPVSGLGREWTATRRLYDQVKQHWHRVNTRYQTKLIRETKARVI